jgi:hypothetical protein
VRTENNLRSNTFKYRGVDMKCAEKKNRNEGKKKVMWNWKAKACEK